MSTKGLLVLMMLLILMSVSSVYGYLVVSNIAGKDGVANYRAANDTITLNVTSLAGAVSLDAQSCACAPYTTLFSCVCTITDSITTASASYTVNSSEPDSAFKAITLDNSIGDITYYVVFSLDNGTVKTVLQYAITDTAFNGGSGCARIKEIVPHWGDREFLPVTINSSQFSGCMISDSIELSIIDSGTDEFYLDVSDRVGNHKISEKKNITIDVTPPDITHLQVMQGDEVLSTISHHAALSVDVTFDIVEENISTITADLSSFNSNPAIIPTLKSVVVPKSNCVYNATDVVYHCMIRNVALYINDADVNPSITVTDTFGNKNTLSENITFTIDDTIPKPSDIGTNHCDSNGTCFVNRQDNIFSVVLDKDNFLTKHIAFQLDNQIIPVANCSERVCVSGNITLVCTSGQSLRLRIAPGSTDDSGNPVDSIEKIVTCDTTTPTFMNDSWSSNYQYDANIIVVQSDLEIILRIRDAETLELHATAYLDALKNATEPGICVNEMDNTFTCTWSVSAINGESIAYDAAVEFNITDTAGNVFSKIITKRILAFTSDNSTPSSLAMQFIPSSVKPAQVDRVALELALRNNLDYFAYANYRIVKKNNVKDARIIYQSLKPSDCRYIAETGYIDRNWAFSQVQIADIYSGIGATNRVDFMFDKSNGGNVNAFHNNFKMQCNVSVYVREGDYIYKKPQILQMEIPFSMRNSRLGTPGQAIANKIKAQEENDLVKAKWLDDLTSLMTTFQTICNFRKYLDAGHLITNVMSVAAHTVQLSTGIGSPESSQRLNFNLESIFNCLYTRESSAQTVEGVLKTEENGNINIAERGNFAKGSCMNIVKEACDFIGCNIAQETNLKGSGVVDLTTTKGIWDNGLAKNLDVPDVSNSIVMAAATKCIPAVIYGVDKWRQSECSYLNCLRLTSSRGLDVSTCDKAKAIQTCSAIVGEAFEMPGVRIGKNFMANLADISNRIGPLAGVAVAKKIGCEDYIDFNTGDVTSKTPKAWQIYTCQIPFQVARFLDGTMRSRRAEQFSYQAIPNACKLGECIGQPNCAYEESTWGKLAGLTQPRSPQDYGRDYGYVNTQELLLNDMSIVSKFVAKKTAEGRTTPRTPTADNKATTEPYNPTITSIVNDPTATADVRAAAQNIIDQKVAGDNKYSTVIAQRSAIISRIDCGTEDCNKLYQVDPATDTNAQLTKNNRDAQLAKMSAADRATYYAFNDRAFDRVNELSAITQRPNVDINSQDYKTAKAALIPIYNSLGIQALDKDGKPVPVTDSNFASVDRTDIIARAREQNAVKRDETESLRFNEQIGNTMYMGISILYQYGILNWMITDNGLGIADYVDPDRWKESLCNPDNTIVGTVANGESQDGVYISCTSGYCTPILNFAAERIEMNRANASMNNSKYYIYSIVYYIGPVYIDPKKGPQRFNTEFRNSKIDVKGYNEWQLIQNNEFKEKSLAFANINKFDEFCIIFADNFPPQDIGGKKEFCKKITENAFFTGNPATDVGNSTTTTGYRPLVGVDQYNVQTRSGRTGEPGLLEG